MESIDQCALCQESKVLKKSHCIPKGILNQCQEDTKQIMIVGGAAFATSYHSKMKFLCGSCEDRFSKFGERTVIGQLLRKTGEFKLREALLNANPIKHNSDDLVYMEIPGIDLDAYRYFAASVFWRSSAARWRIAAGNRSRNMLGAKYKEEFRKYLIGEDDFPKNAALIMTVFSDSQLYPQALWPSSVKKKGFYNHFFLVPGAKFNLFLGGGVPVDVRIPLARSPHGMVVVYEPWEKSELHQLAVRAAKSSPARGALKHRVDEELHRPN